MKAHSIPITDDAQWHELRAKHCSGSEIAALFGEHQHLTPYELYHRKAGSIGEPDLSGDPRIRWGSILENAIIEGVRQQTGWVVRRMGRYYSMLPELGMGGTPDAEIVGHAKGPAVLELKSVDWLQAKRWGDTIPIHFEIQLQTYLALTGRPWGALAILIGGNDLQIHEFQARPKTHELIRRRVAEFWASVEAGVPPTPDYALDHDTISRLYAETAAGKFVDMSDNNRLHELLDEYETSAGMRRRYEREAKALRAEILMAIGDAETVVCGERRLKATSIAATHGTVITEDMVGRQLKGREGYRSLHVTRRREEAA